VKPERVVYILSDGNYSTMVLHDKSEHVFTMNLAHCQQLIEDQLGKDAETFIRIGKQLIINREYIFKINVNKQTLIMADMLKLLMARIQYLFFQIKKIHI
jgi:DNA-binding LytR/AlgR family response regulator